MSSWETALPADGTSDLEKLELDPLFSRFIQNPLFERLTRQILGGRVHLYRAVLWNMRILRPHTGFPGGSFRRARAVRAIAPSWRWCRRALRAALGLRLRSGERLRLGQLGLGLRL